MKVRYDHVTVFVVRPAGSGFEFLQLRRRADDYLGGTWQTVRGTGEAGETSIQTALRELREETGLTPLEFYSVGLVENFYIAADDTMFHSPAFLAIVSADAAITLDAEHDDSRWIDKADAERSFMWPSEKPLVHAILSELLDNGTSKTHLKIKF